MDFFKEWWDRLDLAMIDATSKRDLCETAWVTGEHRLRTDVRGRLSFVLDNLGEDDLEELVRKLMVQ